TADEIARSPALSKAVKSLRSAGYDEVTLVGYSAGGLIARLFVEDAPNCGVTKVIQVCAPNAGSEWAFLRSGVRAVQAPFVRSLAKDDRSGIAQARVDKKIPMQIEFVCIVAAATWLSDGVVRRDAQWTTDLQLQGIPAELIYV